jgi:hypothetical protein
VGDGDGEAGAAARERVEVRRVRRRIAVAAQPVGSKRVDRHEQDVGRDASPAPGVLSRPQAAASVSAIAKANAARAFPERLMSTSPYDSRRPEDTVRLEKRG